MAFILYLLTEDRQFLELIFFNDQGYQEFFPQLLSLAFFALTKLLCAWLVCFVRALFSELNWITTLRLCNYI